MSFGSRYLGPCLIGRDATRHEFMLCSCCWSMTYATKAYIIMPLITPRHISIYCYIRLITSWSPPNRATYVVKHLVYAPMPCFGEGALEVSLAHWGISCD